MFYKLRGRYSEPYRIRYGWGLSPIRNVRELKALIDFCQNELKDRKHMKLNRERYCIYSATVKLYRLTEKGTVPRSGMYFNGKKYINIYQLIQEYIGWYWN
jgi:hypothetical protein